MSHTPKSLLKSLAAPVLNSMNSMLDGRESRLIADPGPRPSPPIFIVGPPRAGTTLVYLLLLRALRTSYFCNLADRFPRWPVQMTRLASSFREIVPSDNFTSKFGETSGMTNPSQGRHIWIRWFPVDAPPGNPGDTLPPLPEEFTRQMQGTVARIEQTMGGPFVNKAQAHCTRVLNLARAFPDMILVRVHRDPYFTAQSILAGRKSFFGDEKQWFSVKPRNVHELEDKPVLEQIAGQIYYLEQGIDRDLEQAPQVPVFSVQYEDFCQDPGAVVRNFKAFYSQHTGLAMEPRFTIPDSFKVSRIDRLPAEKSAALKQSLAVFWND